MISVERMEKALKFLAETDRSEAEHKARYEKQKEKAKSIFATVAAASDAPNKELREAAAYKHEDYKSAKAAEFMASIEWQAERNKRSTESIVIEVWRSLNSSRNKGQVI